MITARLKTDDPNLVELRFPYSPSLVELVKSLPSRKWDNNAKCWVIPLVGLNSLVKMRNLKVTMHQNILDRVDKRKKQLAEIQAVKEKSDSAIVIPQLKLELKPFQKVGVEFLDVVQRGILAFDTGLGKSVTAIAQILRMIDAGIVTSQKKVLILSLASVKRSWHDEFEKFTNEKPVFIGMDYTTKKELKKADRLAFYNSKEFNEAKIVCINFELMLRDIAILKEIPFVAVFIDEAQKIKGIQSKTTNTIKEYLSTPYRYLLTASPMENGLEELWSLIDYVEPSIFGNYWQFRDEFLEIGYFKEITGYKNIDKFKQKLGQVMYRKNKKEVLKDLPPITEDYIYVPMTKEQREGYDALRKKGFAEMKEKLAKLGDRAAQEGKGSVMTSILALNRYCDFPKLTDPNSEHGSCKADECVRILKDLYEQKRKVIIFNKWTKSIAMLKEKIQKEIPQLTVHEYHGDCKATREDAKAAFLGSDHNSILIMSTAGSVGLNLQKADVMINYNRLYNPLAQYQAISRIYRMGQLNPVNIINITVENSVEDKILEILKTKKELFDNVVEDQEFFDELENLSSDELKSLLE